MFWLIVSVATVVVGVVISDKLGGLLVLTNLASRIPLFVASWLFVLSGPLSPLFMEYQSTVESSTLYVEKEDGSLHKPRFAIFTPPGSQDQVYFRHYLGPRYFVHHEPPPLFIITVMGDGSVARIRYEVLWRTPEDPQTHLAFFKKGRYEDREKLEKDLRMDILSFHLENKKALEEAVRSISRANTNVHEVEDRVAAEIERILSLHFTERKDVTFMLSDIPYWNEYSRPS